MNAPELRTGLAHYLMHLAQDGLVHRVAESGAWRWRYITLNREASVAARSEFEALTRDDLIRWSEYRTGPVAQLAEVTRAGGEALARWDTELIGGIRPELESQDAPDRLEGIKRWASETAVKVWVLDCNLSRSDVHWLISEVEQLRQAMESSRTEAQQLRAELARINAERTGGESR